MGIFSYNVDYPLPTLKQIDESNDNGLIGEERPKLSDHTITEVDNTKKLVFGELYRDDDGLELYIDGKKSLFINISDLQNAPGTDWKD